MTTEPKAPVVSFLYSWQLRHTQVTRKMMNLMKPEQVINRLVKNRFAIVNTFAYQKMEDGLYFVTKSNLHDQDDNCKKQARQFALIKHNRIFKAAMSSKDNDGVIRMPSEKMVELAYQKKFKVVQYKIMDKDELDNLKQIVESNNILIHEITQMERDLNRFQWDIPRHKLINLEPRP